MGRQKLQRDDEKLRRSLNLPNLAQIPRKRAENTTTASKLPIWDRPQKKFHCKCRVDPITQQKKLPQTSLTIKAKYCPNYNIWNRCRVPSCDLVRACIFCDSQTHGAIRCEIKDFNRYKTTK